MTESSYWDKFWRKRLTRRGLLAGSAVMGAGLAAAGVVGCGEEAGRKDSDTGVGDSDDPLAALAGDETKPNDARRQLTFENVTPGGTLVYIGFDAVVLDRYDPHQTQFGPMYANQSGVFSKLYAYKSHEEPTWENIMPDLAESAPEMIGDPPTEYIVRLRKGVKFHNTESIRANFPDLAGRELTADDVIFSYERQTNDESPQRAYYYRSSQYKTIERMDKMDSHTIKFTTSGPVAPFFHFMADTNAMIIPREIVDMEAGPDGVTPWDSVDAYQNRQPGPGDRMIGTGPFMWDELKFGIEYVARSNPDWFGWDDPSLGRPFLDAYKATGQGLNDATIENLFTAKQIDVAGYIDNPKWIVSFKNEHPEVEYQRQIVSGWIGTRFKTFCKPFDDVRVRRALHLAIDRREVVDAIGSGSWVMVGPVGRAIKYWALPEEELLSLPGYRTGAEREEDRREARMLYDAAERPDLPLIWFADVPAYIPRFAESYLGTIKAVLGIDKDIKYQAVPYQRIAEGLVKEECDIGPMTWGFDNGWIDLDDWVFPYFRTDGPKNSFKISDPTLDKMLDDQRAEFDIEKRRQLGYDIQRYLLGVTDPMAKAAHSRLDYAAPGGGGISWPYLKNRVSYPWFGNSYWTANVWIDKNDPSYAGRPG